MKKKIIHKPRDKTLISFVFFSILVVIGMTVGYSALNEELGISGEAYVRVEEEIRVTDIKLVEATNGAYETYNSQYSKDTTSMFVTLPNENSSITYEIELTNKGTKNTVLEDISIINNTNGNISYEIIDFEINDIILGNSTKKFKIKLSTSLSNQKSDLVLNYKFEVAQVYQESILNGTYPVLADYLIPVVIEDDGTVKKADTNKKWYSYQNQEWANAIILNDKSIVYQSNQIIPENNIESYFVWIPRYRYQIFNDGNYTGVSAVDASKVQTINVVFENKNTSPSTGQTSGTWLTHPAFTSFDVDGMWVGKFETGYKGATSIATSQVNTINSNKIQIKPNVYSRRYIQTANAFYTSYNYQRTLDSHMMKNTEWGAVAYLQHSKYGSRQEVRINNNSNLMTGYAAVNEPTCGYTNSNILCNQNGTSASITQPYNTEVGYLASTTGNITGIYDMSGGSQDQVMGVMADINGNPMSGLNISSNSGFSGKNADGSFTNGQAWPEKKYYDLYSYSSSNTNYNNGILGDATGEMGPFENITYSSSGGARIKSSWYDDMGWLPYYNNPWIDRGMPLNCGVEAGIFSFHTLNNRGSADVWHGFRIVLSPK